MNKVAIYYYTTLYGEKPIEEFLDSLPKKQKAKIFRVFSYMEVYGLIMALPHVKKLTGTPLWKIRILGQDSMRILYI